MTSVLLTVVVVLVVVCLVVRDQTEFKLRKIRTALMGLRNEDQRLTETRKEVEQLVRQVGEGLSRASKCQRTAERDCRELAEILSGAGVDMSVDEDDSPQVQELPSS